MSLADFTTQTYNPDGLIAGPGVLRHKAVIIVSGQNLARGTLLGRIAGAATGAAVAGGTGNGTIGAVTLGAGAKEGVYRLTCIEPATNAGAFQVEDPDGIVIGVATVGVAFVGAINFTIADGSTDFASGDQFTVTVAAGTKYKKSASAATDGSQDPDCILAEPVDATGGDVTGVAYITGDFNDAKVVFGTGHTAASVRETLRRKGIHLITAQG